MGYFMIDRKIQNHWLWEDKPFTRGQAWVDLILLAEWKDNTGYSRGKTVERKRGEVHRSQVWLADRWGWSRTKLRQFLKALEKEQMIDIKKTQNSTAIIIENYGTYQSFESIKKTQKEQKVIHQKDSKKTAEKQQKNTANTLNTLNTGNTLNNIYKGLHPELAEPFAEYEAMRKKIKKPMTDRAVELQIKKLDRLSGGDVGKAVKILEESIVNCWQDLYPLKSKAEKSSGNPFIDMLEEN